MYKNDERHFTKIGVIVISIGKVNHLKINRETRSGYYLLCEDGDEVFMPAALGPARVKIGNDIAVFVYLDTKGERIATSDIPYAIVGEYFPMRVVDVQEFGAFLDWGTDKDLLVPGNQQKIKMRLHETYLVRVCLEDETNRIYGTTKLGKYIEASDYDFVEGDTVKMLPYQKTDLGYKVVIGRKFVGMIYSNEIFTPIVLGDLYEGVVKKIRPDGLVDAALQIQGIANVVDAKDKILALLKDSDGKTFLNDKSSPAEIKSMLGMSKKTFKKASGMLYKEKKINITPEGLELI